MRDPRSFSFAIPLGAVGLLLAALFLALFPAVPEPLIPISKGPPISRTSVLRRWMIEREQRLFVERLQRELEVLEIQTEKFRACKKLDGGPGVLKVNDSPQPDPVAGPDDPGVGPGDEAD